jgi:hypothetical protein
MPTTQLTILIKNDLFTFLGLIRGELLALGEEAQPVTAVVKHDPREGQPWLKQFASSGEAVRSYEGAITKSVARGWGVVYRGAPLQG